MDSRIHTLYKITSERLSKGQMGVVPRSTSTVPGTCRSLVIYVRSYDMSAQSKGSPCPAPLPLNSPQGFIQDVPLRGGDRGAGQQL